MKGVIECIDSFRMAKYWPEEAIDMEWQIYLFLSFDIRSKKDEDMETIPRIWRDNIPSAQRFLGEAS